MLDDTNFYSTFYTQTQSDAKYQTISNVSNYPLSSSITNTLTSYLTSSGASNLYQAKGSYLTTYRPLSTTYLSIIDANSTYHISPI